MRNGKHNTLNLVKSGNSKSQGVTSDYIAYLRTFVYTIKDMWSYNKLMY